MTPAQPEPARPEPAPARPQSEPGPARGVALRVTTIELFFDLVFAFTLTQLTTLLADHASLPGTAQVLLIFALIWWMYAGCAWLTNALPPAGAAERLPLLAGMGGLLIAGLAIPEGFGRNGAVLGLGYLALVLVHTWLYRRVNRNIMRVAPFNIAAALLVTAAGLISRHPGGSRPAVYALWVVAVAVQLGSPFVLKPGGRFDLQPAHIVERHTALVIVALGESVAAVGIGATRPAGRAGGMSAGLIGVSLLGLALSAGLWWALFGSSEDERSQQALTGTGTARRTSLILNAYFYAYTAVLLGIVAVSAGMEQAIARADAPPAAEPAAAAVLLAAGAAAVLAGDLAFRRAMGIGRSWLRLAATVAAAATIAAGLLAGLPAQLGLLTVIFVGMIAGERLLKPDPEPQDPATAPRAGPAGG
jgi:low temperature requirement protein LtrA